MPPARVTAIRAILEAGETLALPTAEALELSAALGTGDWTGLAMALHATVSYDGRGTFHFCRAGGGA
jgi:hypothetical protein